MVDEMERLAELGAELYPTEGPSTGLRARSLARPERAWLRPALVAAGVAVLAAGGVAVAVGTAGRPAAHVQQHVAQAAFAVKVNGDGSVTFTAYDLVDTAAATKALNDAGIAGRVVNMTSGGKDGQVLCAKPLVNRDDLDPSVGLQKSFLYGDSPTITVSKSSYRPGGGLLLVVGAVGHKADGRVLVVVLSASYKDARKIPSSVPGCPPPRGAPR
jgi:hypothetical protein